jgi:hypothetical protein
MEPAVVMVVMVKNLLLKYRSYVKFVRHSQKIYTVTIYVIVSVWTAFQT